VFTALTRRPRPGWTALRRVVLPAPDLPMKAESLPGYEKIDRDAERMDTPYDAWASSQGIDVVKGYFVEDVYTLPLKWWERMGGYGTERETNLETMTTRKDR
jgi:hypothetical protein